MQSVFLKKAGLPYQPLQQSRVDPAEAAHDGAASPETAEALQVGIIAALDAARQKMLEQAGQHLG